MNLNKNTINTYIGIVGIGFCVACHSTPRQNNLSNEKPPVPAGRGLINDNVLKCHQFTYRDGYFITADYGCIYDQKDKNSAGNMVVCLIPKSELVITADQIIDEEKKVNALTIDQYKANYQIYAYLIEKKYLNYNAKGDPAFYQKDNFTEKLYTYRNASQKWELIDTIRINSDAAKEQNWRDRFLTESVGKLKRMASAPSGTHSISAKWFGNYTFTTNEHHSDWRDMQTISLTITKDSILYHAEGYQIDQTYRLSGVEIDHTLKLQFESAGDNTASAVLEKTKDFGTVSRNDQAFTWACPYIDLSFGNGKNNIYTLKKQ